MSPLPPGGHHTGPGAHTPSSFTITGDDWFGGQRPDGSWQIREGGPGDESALGFVEVDSAVGDYRSLAEKMKLPGLEVGQPSPTTFAGSPAVRVDVRATQEVEVPVGVPLAGFQFASGDHGYLLFAPLGANRAAGMYVGALTLSADEWAGRVAPVLESWRLLG